MIVKARVGVRRTRNKARSIAAAAQQQYVGMWSGVVMVKFNVWYSSTIVLLVQTAVDFPIVSGNISTIFHLY